LPGLQKGNLELLPFKGSAEALSNPAKLARDVFFGADGFIAVSK
jgi:hypothetical protein